MKLIFLELVPVRWLHRLPPEAAHHIAILVLSLWQRLLLIFRRFHLRPPCIQVGAGGAGLRLSHRLGLAAGFDKDAEVFPAMAALGFGFVEVGTVTPRPQLGNAKPRIWRPAPNTLLNHLGFNSCGLQKFRENLLRFRGATDGFPILANIGKNRNTPLASSLDDYEECWRGLAGLVEGFVLNLSSPNTPGLVDLQNLGFLDALEQRLPAQGLFLLKCSPDLPDAGLKAIVERISQSSKLRGVVLTNTSRRVAEEAFKAPAGGISGAPLADRSIECLKLARAILPPPKILISAGGVLSGADVAQRIQLGADLVEVYTGFVYRGPALLREAGA